MKVLVTFAVAAEFASWKRRHGFRRVATEPYPLYAGDIGGSMVRVVLTGVGMAPAMRAIRWALGSPTDVCISSGFAGALQPDMKAGDVLVARVVRRAEKDLAVASDRDLFATALDAGAHSVDRLLTSEQLVLEALQKAQLAREADAVEMESFVILAEAARVGVRAMAVRAISDGAEANLPYDFAKALDARGRIRWSAVAAAAIRQPGRIPALMRLSRDCRLASRCLAEVLDRCVSQMSLRFDVAQSEMVTT